ncbi:MAG TPA: hypothetical protein VKV74_01030 [Bryobacteraceae bacterium]|nr:hypothetical protein [Bryobacteraceae bacterium]HZT21700.1 hypothetical protein [Verrucomicrobiae bacterium]
MSNPVSQPVIPSQPDQLYYGVSALALFQTFTRDTYLSTFGIQAPPYDPSRVIKTWFDSTVDTSNPSNVALYNVVGQDNSGNWGLQQLVMPAQEAATVNLTGAVTYPPYVAAPTQATRGGSGINPLYMSLESDAQEIMTEIGGTTLLDEGSSPVFPVIYPANEPRRVWDVVFKGQPLNVGMLLSMKYANGVGAPGHWDTSGSDPVWVADPPPPTGVGDTRPPRPMPVRNLLPNEQFQTGLMGVGIIRTDLEQSQQAQNGQFTSDDRATLQTIYQIVSKLAQ